MFEERHVVAVISLKIPISVSAAARRQFIEIGDHATDSR